MSTFKAKTIVAAADGVDPSLLMEIGISRAGNRMAQQVTLLFNMPENLHRVMSSNGVSVNKVSHVLLPSLSSRSLGGFPSVYLSVMRRQKQKYKSFSGPIFIGPKGLDEILSAYGNLSRAFKPLTCVPVAGDETDICLEDDLISAFAFHSERLDSQHPGWLCVEPTINLISDDDEAGPSTSAIEREAMEVIDLTSEVEILPEKRPRRPGREGEFKVSGSDAAAIWCYALLLKESMEVVMVFFLENEDALRGLTSHPHWDYLLHPELPVAASFHLSSADLMQKQVYKTWMSQLTGEQIVVDSTVGAGVGMDLGLQQMFKRTLRLRTVAPRFFPLPYSFLSGQSPLGKIFPDGNLPPRVSSARLLTEVVQDPSQGSLIIRNSPLEEINPSNFVQNALQIDGRLRQVNSYNEARFLHLDDPWSFYINKMSNPGLLKPRENADDAYWMEIYEIRSEMRTLAGLAESKDESYLLFLGTGCAEPSPWRGNSAILVSNAKSRRKMLLDCGEGTYGQMVRHLGPQEAQEAVDALELVWISHKHVDHSTGLPSVLERRSPRLPALTVVCPASVWGWIRRSSYRVRWVRNTDPVSLAPQLANCGVSAWTSVAVEHTCEAYAVSITFRDSIRIVYSGDTRPCDALVEAGMGCSLLIHEATHSCLHLPETLETKHSTWREAIAVGEKMEAFRVVLTHFSRRYPGLPEGLTYTGLGRQTAIAFDGMLIKFKDLMFLPSHNEGMAVAVQELEFGGDLATSEDEEVIDLLSDLSGDLENYS